MAAHAAWCHAGVDATAIITAPSGAKYKYAAHLSFALEIDKCTNNIAEYKAIILRLCKLRALGIRTCIVKTDSKVVAGQIEKGYVAREPALLQYLSDVQSLDKQFKGFTIQHINRNKNEEADSLAKAAVRADPMPSDVFFQVIETPIIREPNGHKVVSLIMAEDWRAPITLYLQGHYHPTDQAKAKRLKYQSHGFTIIKGQLYRRGLS